MTSDLITMAHGSGSGLHTLLKEIVLPHLLPAPTDVLEDAAVFDVPQGRLAFTTDSFVVQPLEFAGGDIGKLAACGTINDLAVMGARPDRISVALILEEGLEISLLTRVLSSLKEICSISNVQICCGDTKVINRGSGDGLYINTAGIGALTHEGTLSAAHARAGDAVIVSGDIARHGISILSSRQQLGFESDIASDCAPLDSLCAALLEAAPETRVIRDATRGGCAAVLNEIAAGSNVTMVLNEYDLPVLESTRQACEFLGLDPLQVANEGTFVAVIPDHATELALEALHKFDQGKQAAVIGRIEAAGRFPVIMTTEIGGRRPVEVPPGELLPRIC